jgi:cytochrome c oxidase subunit 3
VTTGLHEPFTDLSRQRQAAEFGIWIFLATEVLFFGGLFTGYTIYRFLYPDGFAAAGAETDIWYGTINTALLLTSSATMAVAVWSGRAGLRGTVLLGLSLTLVLGFGFLAIKGLEYHEDFQHHLLPSSLDFPVDRAGARIFISFYWVMTGVHAVHLSVGLALVGLTIRRVRRNSFDWQHTGFLHVLGLYWHLIDLIWIFLYPLLYLLGR